MNQEKFNHIASNPNAISAQDARELEELNQKFPFFSLPYVLLSHYYHASEDYRFEETLQKAAIRVPDREWLYYFIHSTNEKPVQTPAPTEKMEVAQTNLAPPSPKENTAETKKEVRLDTGNIPDFSHFGIELPASLLEIDTAAITESEEFTSDTGSMDLEIELPSHERIIEIDDGLSEKQMPEIPNKTDTDVKKEENTDEVFEEIIAFDTPLAYSLETHPSQYNAKEPNSDVANLEENSLKADAEVTEQEENGEIKNISAEKEEINQPPPKVSATIQSVAYNIEDYYPSHTNENENPKDFFSWLSNPKFNESDKIKNEKNENETKESLIDLFIRTNPHISRPKADFFKPADEAKKSESLPDDLATETLANVYLGQGNFAQAIKIYDKLMLKFPEKSAYFANLIQKINKEHNL